MNLIIGGTSQLGTFLPKDYVRMSSREVNTNNVKNYDCVYITFAEQRTFNKNLKEKDFINVNVEYTSKIVNEIQNLNKKIVLYGTFELWNSYSGPVSIDSPIKYNYSPYIKSKDMLYNLLLDKRVKGEWGNVFMIHPTNFNSIKRKEGFLFNKIFNSIINKTIIEVGDLNINRDLIHPKYLVEKSINCKEDMIVASGKLTNLKTFIKELYNSNNLNYYDYVIENDSFSSPHKNNSFWLKTNDTYDNLLEDTLDELKSFIK